MDSLWYLHRLITARCVASSLRWQQISGICLSPSFIRQKAKAGGVEMCIVNDAQAVPAVWRSSLHQEVRLWEVFRGMSTEKKDVSAGFIYLFLCWCVSLLRFLRLFVGSQLLVGTDSIVSCLNVILSAVISPGSIPAISGSHHQDMFKVFCRTNNTREEAKACEVRMKGLNNKCPWSSLSKLPAKMSFCVFVWKTQMCLETATKT